ENPYSLPEGTLPDGTVAPTISRRAVDAPVELAIVHKLVATLIELLKPIISIIEPLAPKALLVIPLSDFPTLDLANPDVAGLLVSVPDFTKALKNFIAALVKEVPALGEKSLIELEVLDLELLDDLSLEEVMKLL